MRMPGAGLLKRHEQLPRADSDRLQLVEVVVVEFPARREGRTRAEEGIADVQTVDHAILRRRLSSHCRQRGQEVDHAHQFA